MSNTSSTEAALQTLAERFYDTHLAPLARERAHGGRSLMSPPGGAPETSLFLPPPRSHMEPEDFELGASESSEAFALAMEEHWATRMPGLVGVRADLEAMGDVAVAAALLAEEEEEISPFLYAMF